MSVICSFDGQTVEKFTGSGYCNEVAPPNTNYIFGQLADNDSRQYAITHFLAIIDFASPISHITAKTRYTTAISFIVTEMPPKIYVKTTNQTYTKNMYAVLRIDRYDATANVLYCEIERVLGQVGDKVQENMLMEQACTNAWSGKKKVALLFRNTLTQDLTPNRITIDDTIRVYTIDPADCVDRDDALHYRYDEQSGTHEIGIHISDVSSWIAENSGEDAELAARISSVYAKHVFDNDHTAVHMIPYEYGAQMSLSVGPRRAFSIIVTLSLTPTQDTCTIVSVAMQKVMVNITDNITYDDAQKAIDDGTDSNLAMMMQIARKISKGDTSTTYDSHDMVGTYMVLANQLVAEKLASVYPEDVLLRAHGQMNNEPTNYAVSDDLPDDQNVPMTYLLKHKHDLVSCESAAYQRGTHNCTHNGLKLAYYTHFTSPLRRYADILVHRQLFSAASATAATATTHIPTLTIFTMNFANTYHKRIERYVKKVRTVNAILENKQDDVTDAYIVHISGSRLQLYIPKYDYDTSMDIFNNRLDEIYEIVPNEQNRYIIKNMQNGQQVALQLFEKIQVKIGVLQRRIVDLRIELVILGNIA